MAGNYCRALLISAKTGLLLLVVLLWTVPIASGQQAGGLTQTPPQASPQGQIGATQQNAQLEDLSGQQPGSIDSRQSAQPSQYDQQQGTLEQGAVAPNHSQMRQGAGQPGQSGLGASQPGELGIFIIASDGPGVRVARIVTGSPADEAGVEAGDVLMAINGQNLEQPQEVIRIIRAIPAGELANLRVWRDGQEQDLVATLRPMRQRERYESNFRGESSGMNGDLAQRTQRLEQQLSMVMQELQRLRQELMQLRAGRDMGAGAGTTGLNAQQPVDARQPTTEPLNTNSTQPGLDRQPGQPGATDPDTGLPF
jgi:membrane-associated protease RseP (regulator of RpoE activity)